nr:hypothetical protein [Streptomyces xanthophaeus]
MDVVDAGRDRAELPSELAELFVFFEVLVFLRRDGGHRQQAVVGGAHGHGVCDEDDAQVFVRGGRYEDLVDRRPGPGGVVDEVHERLVVPVAPRLHELGDDGLPRLLAVVVGPDDESVELVAVGAGRQASHGVRSPSLVAVAVAVADAGAPARVRAARGPARP